MNLWVGCMLHGRLLRPSWGAALWAIFLGPRFAWPLGYVLTRPWRGTSTPSAFSPLVRVGGNPAP